jgi:predicted RNA-binding Zn-ribbon protein involved in translation (DUF1610 family)
MTTPYHHPAVPAPRIRRWWHQRYGHGCLQSQVLVPHQEGTYWLCPRCGEGGIYRGKSVWQVILGDYLGRDIGSSPPLPDTYPEEVAG